MLLSLDKNRLFNDPFLQLPRTRVTWNMASIRQGTGTDRETLIRITGINDRALAPASSVTDPYVPVNANKVTVASAADFKVGDEVVVKRPSTKKWISTLGTETFGGGISALGWKP